MKNGLELTLLGAPQIRWRGNAVALQPRHLALVCYLALDGPSPRDDLAELLWGAGKSASLRTALYTMRRLPGAASWLGDAERVGVAAQSDVAALEEALETTSFAGALPFLEGDTLILLDGLKPPTPAFEEWLEEKRRTVADLLSSALWGAAQACRNQGQPAQAHALAFKLTVHDPHHEPAYRLLMRLAHESADPDSVRSAFERCRAVMTELGGEPAPETFKLRAELLGAEGAVAQGTRFSLGDAIPGRASSLIGRNELLSLLGEAVGEHPTLLHGFGGVGKTALAAEFASTYLSTGDVLWLHVGRSSEAEVLGAARQALGLSGTDPAALSAALERVALLVLDDAWSSAALRTLQNLVPPELAVLASSRQRLPGFSRIPLGSLARADAKRLLEFVAERTLPNDEVETICHVLADHPFALRLAGAQLRGGASPAQLLARLANTPHMLAAPTSWRDEARESISALLTASLDMLGDSAYHAFLAIGALGSSAVTPEFLALCTRRDLGETEAALIELQGQALAERRAQPGSDVVRYLLHDLSYSFSRHNTTLRARSVMRACCTFLTENTRAFELLGAELPNIVGALETAHDTGERELLVEMMALLVVGDAYFSARGHTPRTLKLLEKALLWAKELGQLERAHYLATKLGDAHRELFHQYAEALGAYEEGIRLATLLRDTSREAILTSLCAITVDSMGQPSEALFQRAYRLAQSANDDLVRCQILQGQAYIAWTQENWEVMEKLHREEVAITTTLRQKEAADPTKLDDFLFFALLNLGEAKRKRGYLEEAVSLRLQALEIAVSRDNQLWRAYAYQELGDMYAEMTRLQDAKTYLEQALALYEENNARAEVGQVKQLLLSLYEFTPS